MRPYDAKDNWLVCRLARDNFDAGDFWILTDGTRVTLASQKAGESPTQSITIPRAEFNKLVAWYMRDQKTIKAA